MLYLHVSEACRSSLSPLPTILLSSRQFSLMSKTHPTSTSSNFQLIFDNALKAYKKRTKNDLLTHPLADRLESCDSASSILTVFQEQVQEFNESQRSNMKWLDPTVNVFHAFSETLGEGIGTVCFITWTSSEIYPLIFIYLTGILTCKGYRYWIYCPPFGVYLS